MWGPDETGANDIAVDLNIMELLDGSLDVGIDEVEVGHMDQVSGSQSQDGDVLTGLELQESVDATRATRCTVKSPLQLSAHVGFSIMETSKTKTSLNVVVAKSKPSELPSERPT
ncbi:hypothetical protein PIB30_009346 [Stylosanthes scabra]|uniref:Uncharacterized protein n=1 Tax=Stylosanthes scabra TaxID=79078 RepID=A0ABU6U3Y1_9FABA|nr:hypothetical protein [Stylosanthes scabra]